MTDEPFNPPEQIETARLSLRKPCLEYASLVFAAYAQDSEVTRYLTWRPHKTLSDARSVMERIVTGWDAGTEYSWFIFSRDTNELIGSVAARMDAHRVDIGHALARSYWGQGLMTEALESVVQWAFTESSVCRVWAVCDIENSGSARVLEKAGFQREGILKQWAIHPNISPVPRDCYAYARTRTP